jgi:succinate dehydrogenase / fumarate reductase cytochrome b subunit
MSTATKPHSRPLSPHLQVYRLPLAAMLSVYGHRVTGIGLFAGLILLTGWVAAAAYGEETYAVAIDIISSLIGQIILLGFSIALYFHACTGIRHLFWDVGKGFEIAQTQRSNFIVLAAAIILTAVTWLIAKG